MGNISGKQECPPPRPCPPCDDCPPCEPEYDLDEVLDYLFTRYYDEIKELHKNDDLRKLMNIWENGDKGKVRDIFKRLINQKGDINKMIANFIAKSKLNRMSINKKRSLNNKRIQRVNKDERIISELNRNNTRMVVENLENKGNSDVLILILIIMVLLYTFCKA